MQLNQLRIISLIFLLFGVLNLNATHNRAGEITYIQTGPQSIQVTITTYTKTSSENADRNELTVEWGDGTSTTLVRSNGPIQNGYPNGEPLANDTKKNIYTGTHTYPSLGHYVIAMTDPNRNGQICNLNGASPDNVAFHLQTTVTLFNQTFSAPNNSPILLQPPVDIGCVGQPFYHNPNAYDADGDSLAYRLIVPLQARDSEVPLYLYPNQVQPGIENTYSFNEATGDFFWNTPQQACEYNIAMYIIEYRDGTPIDTMIRDLQILIESCDNLPPEVETIEEICVVAGETVEFDVTATAPTVESDQRVNLTATGGPFQLNTSPATFDNNDNYRGQPLTKTFRWETTCEHIDDQYYTVIFRSADNYPVTIDPVNGDTSTLSTLKMVRIKIVGPPPEELGASAEDNQVILTWQNPYVCENAANEYFRGFTVWKRINSNPFTVDTCETGLTGRGYTEITTDPIQDISGGDYTYIDFDIEPGQTYCYRVLAEFSKLTPSGFAFNTIEGLTSAEVCIQQDRNIPLLTNVDVKTTDLNIGQIEVIWSTPDVNSFDTIANPGPYVYELWRAEGYTASNFEIVPNASFTAPNFYQAVDTVFLDTNLNTTDNPYTYRLAFYASGNAEPIDYSPDASSVHIDVVSSDRKNTLAWEETVPWTNIWYYVYKLEGTEYVFQDSTNQQFFADRNLINGVEYCYKIESKGSYNIDGIKTPLINTSQEACGIPIDTVPPCPTNLSLSNLCEDTENFYPEEDFVNNLSWRNPASLCEESSDVEGYKIYYTPQEGGQLQLIHTIDIATDTSFTHRPASGIAGCYAVTTFDGRDNESRMSNIVCTDNCPLYQLPNTFTPNGDGRNDVFRPFPYRFISKVEFKVFNQWGNLVFETTNPDLDWNGQNTGGKELSPGVYYYTCKVFESRVTGIVENATLLNGWIELVR